MSGYREDTFDLDTPEPEEPLTPTEARGVNRIVIGFGIGFFLLLDVVSWFSEGGGIFSLITAAASHARSPVIDIDKAALQFPIMLVTLLIIVLASSLFGLKLGPLTRRKAWVVLPVIGAAFVLDIMFGEPLITHYMVTQGYTCCPSQDHEQGTGKGAVFFANYVLRSSDCRGS